MLPAEEHRMRGTPVVRGADQRVRGGVRGQPRDGGRGHSRQVHEVHERRLGGRRLQRGQSGPQRRAHALGPAVRHDGLHAVRERGTGLLGRGAEHDDHGSAAAVHEHAYRAPDERLATDLDERLRPAHPAPGAGGQQQARDGYLLISVTGCTYGTSSNGNSTSPNGESEPWVGRRQLRDRVLPVGQLRPGGVDAALPGVGHGCSSSCRRSGVIIPHGRAGGGAATGRLP
ncbi:hypothetical protein BJF78_13000 [Pseudonocardia sp. CNS-139]|nr:hypothetical protein BJF78_13000 [Pseudonocardia sp. CNS-139]